MPCSWTNPSSKIKDNLYKAIDNINFGHITTSEDMNFGLAEASYDQLRALLISIKCENQNVVAMKSFCSNDFLCYACENEEVPVYYYARFLSNLFKRLFLTFPYKYLIIIAEKVYNSLFDKNDEFYIDVEKRTQCQTNSNLWHLMRCGRVTASIFKKCCNANIENPPKSLLKQIVFPHQSNVSCVYTNWGKNHEDKAVKILFEKIKHDHINLKKRQCGLIINKEFPFLGASPDALFDCNCHGSYPVEIKCPYTLRFSKYSEDLLQMNNAFLENVDGLWKMKATHEYFYQVIDMLIISTMSKFSLLRCKEFEPINYHIKPQNNLMKPFTLL